MEIKVTRQNVVDAMLQGEAGITVDVGAIKVETNITREDLVRIIASGETTLVGTSSVIKDSNKEEY